MHKSIIKIESLNKSYKNSKGFRSTSVTKALNNVSFSIDEGEILGLIGESGSGKSTLAKCLVNLTKADSGHIYFYNMDITKLSGSQLSRYARKVQMVFQHPVLALNPAHSIRTTLAEPLRVIAKIPKDKIQTEIDILLKSVGLDNDILDRFPRQISGGQKQRVAVARALSIKPKILIADEPTSSLDADFKQQVLNLIIDLKNRLGLTVLLISHDIASMEYSSDRIAVMFKGNIIEMGPTKDVLNAPLHPYTKELIAASYLQYEKISTPAYQERITADFNRCAFYDRCPVKQSHCMDKIPYMTTYTNNHSAACYAVSNKNKSAPKENTKVNYYDCI